MSNDTPVMRANRLYSQLQNYFLFYVNDEELTMYHDNNCGHIDFYNIKGWFSTVYFYTDNTFALKLLQDKEIHDEKFIYFEEDEEALPVLEKYVFKKEEE